MSHFLTLVSPWADWWIANLWRSTWQGAIVVAVVWAVARLFTFLSPRVVCWLWRLACLKILVALVWAAPVLLPLLPAQSSTLQETQAIAVHATATGANASGSLPMLFADGGHVTRGRQLSLAAAAKLILTGVWIVGVVFMAAFAVRQWRGARRLVALSVPARERPLRAVCRQQARAIGVRRLPELRISRVAGCPALVGIARPTIVFPHDVLATFDASELGLIAGHELAHQRRHDLAWNWLLLAVRGLFFFHPLVWLLARGWEEAQETACDALVLERGTARPSEYGRLLLTLATRPTVGQRPSFAVAGVFGTWGILERRVLAMANFRPLSRSHLAGAFVLLLMGATVTVVPWRLVAQESKPGAVAKDSAPAQGNPPTHAAYRLSMNNLKQILLAMHNYAADTDKNAPGGNHRLPAAYLSKDGKPLLSWRVAILPYLDAKALYAEFHLDEPWDSEHNKKLIAQIPDFYLSPASNLTDGRTVYLTPRAAETAFPGDKALRFLDLHDGTSNTVAVVEVSDGQAVPWTKPDDLPINWDKLSASVAGRYMMFDRPGFLSGFVDGSAHWFPNDLNKDTLKAIFTASGGEVVDWTKVQEETNRGPNGRKSE